MLQFSPVFVLYVVGVATLVFYELRRQDAEPWDASADSLFDRKAKDVRLDAWQTNERIKMSAAYANNLSVGLLVGGLVGPSVKGDYPNPLWYLGLVFVALCLHLGARALAGSLRSEEWNE